MNVLRLVMKSLLKEKREKYRAFSSYLLLPLFIVEFDSKHAQVNLSCNVIFS